MIRIAVDPEPLEGIGTAVSDLFSDGLGFFLTYLVPGAALLAIASVGLRWGIKKFRENAK